MVWTHIHLEGYCMFNTMNKKTFNAIDGNGKKLKDINNPNYTDPSLRPKWCVEENKKFVPKFMCLCGECDNKCPFFAFTDCEEDEYVMFDEAWNIHQEKEDGAQTK